MSHFLMSHNQIQTSIIVIYPSLLRKYQMSKKYIYQARGHHDITWLIIPGSDSVTATVIVFATKTGQVTLFALSLIVQVVASIFSCVSFWQVVWMTRTPPYWLESLTFAVLKHHDQSNLERKGFILAYTGNSP